MFWPKAEDRGRPRFFADQTYNFQTLRALDDMSDIGGDAGEMLQTIAGLKSGDAQGWYDAWQATGDRVVALADRTNDTPWSHASATWIRSLQAKQGASILTEPLTY
jgi:hypothetical protein